MFFGKVSRFTNLRKKIQSLEISLLREVQNSSKRGWELGKCGNVFSRSYPPASDFFLPNERKFVSSR